ncbi:MAG TPA: TetR/AcrR family transcriptional regulator [Candidatus Binatia bacterium]|nr:TetR/AcrR family transcriptional regulator [Candidatus Binatia bacterium]
MTTQTATLDGRRARSLKTRHAIVDATIALLESGDLKPTAASVAERAGLSVRSIFQHFTDLEDLFVAVSDRQANRVADLYAGTEYEGDLESRLASFVSYRSRLFETVAPVRRAAILQEPFSPTVADRLAFARVLQRVDLERAFAPELAIANAQGKAWVVEALCAVSSFTMWDELRRSAGLSLEAATEAYGRGVEAILRCAQAPSS